AAARAFFTDGDTGDDEENAFGGEVAGAARGISEERIAAVDDDVSSFKVRQDCGDGFVDRGAGFDHEHDAAWTLEKGRELGDGVGADDIGSFCFIGDEVVDLGDGPVEDRDLESMVVHVEDEILSHDCKADEAGIARWFRHEYSPMCAG